MKTLDILRQNVERERKRRGWKQKDLAKNLSMAPNQLSRTLRGKNSPTLESIERIAQALGLSVGRLLTHPDELALREDRPVMDSVDDVTSTFAKLRAGETDDPRVQRLVAEIEALLKKKKE